MKDIRFVTDVEKEPCREEEVQGYSWIPGGYTQASALTPFAAST